MDSMVNALKSELLMRSDSFSETITTVYFGGGTPSVLPINHIEEILHTVGQQYTLNAEEITFEANPEDLSPEYLDQLLNTGINRLSIGVQSFDERLLKEVNRNHSASEAIIAFQNARKAGFQNINLDLIYALPGSSEEILIEDLQQIKSLSPEHISIYAYTVEPKTVFENWIRKKKIELMDEDQEAEQYEQIIAFLQDAHYEHYEISNFARDKNYSLHNSSYWNLTPYLGIGPSAHSFYEGKRWSNPAHNKKYSDSINKKILPSINEERTAYSEINEYIFTSLRTIWGCDTHFLKNKFAYDLIQDQRLTLDLFMQQSLISLKAGVIKLTGKGKLLADDIASRLFLTEE